MTSLLTVAALATTLAAELSPQAMCGPVVHHWHTEDGTRTTEGRMSQDAMFRMAGVDTGASVVGTEVLDGGARMVVRLDSDGDALADQVVSAVLDVDGRIVALAFDADADGEPEVTMDADRTCGG